MTNKKVRTKIPKENKVRAELQREIGSLCPFCDNSDVGHFQIHHIDENPLNNINQNLLLLCPICHSKITKGDIKQEDVLRKKVDLLVNLSHKKDEIKGVVNNFNDKINHAIIGDNNKVLIKNPKKIIKQKYPEGCIGFDTNKANYISRLIDRYNEYKEYEVGKGNVKYAVFSSQLKKRFKIGQTRTLYNLPIGGFDELVEYICKRIDGTTLAKIKGKNHKNYSSFNEFVNEQK